MKTQRRDVDARARLGRTLQLAYSGELGAIRAYLGHHAACRDRADRAGIMQILKDEVRHRRRVGEMMTELGVDPDPYRERKMNVVGRFISLTCFTSGWFIPMYGAARLESGNIVEYEIAAQWAWLADQHPWVDELLHMAEVEWDHELWLRQRAQAHFLWRVFPKWKRPAPRDTIRQRFADFRRLGAPTLRPRVAVISR